MNRFRFVLVLFLALITVVPGTTGFAAEPVTRLEKLDHQIISDVQALRPPPKQGWVRGTIGTKNYEITIDRIAWTITGSNGAFPYNLKINHDARAIQGEANNEPLNIGFEWSPEQVIYDGDAYGYPYHVEVVWKDGTAVGGIACSMLKTSFDLEKGTFSGYLGDRNVNLTYDKVSGRVTGEFFKRPLNLVLTNLDFSDFIQHLYLFLR